jgi:hypothetical protein
MCGASTLMRGRVCRLQLLLALASAVILRSESRGIRDSHQPGGPGPRIYIPQEQGGPVIPPGTGFHFRRLLRLAGLRWRYSNPPPREDQPHKVRVTLRLAVYRRSVHLGAKPLEAHDRIFAIELL